MANTSTITEADILSQVIAPGQSGLSPESARSILELRFSDAAKDRIRDLMNRNNRGTITDAEVFELEKYLRVGMFLDLIQAKACVSLRQQDSQTD